MQSQKLTKSLIVDAISKIVDDGETSGRVYITPDFVFEVIDISSSARSYEDEYTLAKTLQLRDSLSIVFSGEYIIDVSNRSDDEIIRLANTIQLMIEENGIDYAINELMKRGLFEQGGDD